MSKESVAVPQDELTEDEVSLVMVQLSIAAHHSFCNVQYLVFVKYCEILSSA